MGLGPNSGNRTTRIYGDTDIGISEEKGLYNSGWGPFFFGHKPGTVTGRRILEQSSADNLFKFGPQEVLGTQTQGVVTGGNSTGRVKGTELRD